MKKNQESGMQPAKENTRKNARELNDEQLDAVTGGADFEQWDKPPKRNEGGGNYTCICKDCEYTWYPVNKPSKCPLCQTERITIT